MEWLWFKLSKPLRVLWSYIVALARLVIWTILFFFTGLQRTLFMRCEVASAELKVIPLRCDMADMDEKIAYVDKLCAENPDLMVLAEEELPDEEDFPFDEDEDDNSNNGDL